MMNEIMRSKHTRVTRCGKAQVDEEMAKLLLITMEEFASKGVHFPAFDAIHPGTGEEINVTLSDLIPFFFALGYDIGQCTVYKQAECN